MKAIIFSLLLCLFFSASIVAQVSTPSGYTTNLGLRLYDQGDTPGADSLNQNWTDIDDFAGVAVKTNTTQTITAIKTFNGAVFNAGSHGKVTFADSVILSGSRNETHLTYPYDNTTSKFGEVVDPYNRMYARGFVVVASNGDSAVVTHDGTNIDFSRSIQVDTVKINTVLSLSGGADISMTDSTILTGLALSGTGYTFSAISDSVITLAAVKSSIIFRSFGFSVTGVETINMTGAGNEQVLAVTNNVSFTVVMEDEATSGGNLRLNGNYSMGKNDVLLLKYDSSDGYWEEVSRSPNGSGSIEAYGTMYIISSDPDTITLGTAVWAPIEDMTQKNAYNVTNNVAAGQCTVTYSGTYRLGCNFSVDSDATFTIEADAHVNGVRQDETGISEDLTAATGQELVAISGILSLTAGDVIDIRLLASAGSPGVVIKHLNFNLFRIY